MYKKEVLKYFRRFPVKGLADFLGITMVSIGKWGDIIPLEKALILEKLTEGELSCELRLYPSTLGNKLGVDGNPMLVHEFLTRKDIKNDPMFG